MSSEQNLQIVRDYYKGISDQELIHISTDNASGITPEAMEIVEAEILSRGLPASVANGMKAQNRIITEQEIDGYISMIREQPCPICGGVSKPLNGSMVAVVTSFLFLTQYKRSVKIGCPDCLNKANNKAIIHSSLLGWWGIPWGLIRTPQAIVLNFKSKSNNRRPEPSPSIRRFTASSIGRIVAYKDDLEGLQGWLRANNSKGN